ncbi:hypothetical protein RhiirC2_762673, partial [Rhizophagus irregularis]
MSKGPRKLVAIGNLDPKGDSDLFSNGFLNTTLNSTIRNDEFENYKDTANDFCCGNFTYEEFDEKST